MYMDDDGQLAHEFYREGPDGKMQRVWTDLRPQVCAVVVDWSRTNTCVRPDSILTHQPPPSPLVLLGPGAGGAAAAGEGLAGAFCAGLRHTERRWRRGVDLHVEFCVGRRVAETTG